MFLPTYYLCNGLFSFLWMIRSSRSELLVCMIREGILRVIGDIIVSETDPLVLVCLLSFFIFNQFLILFAHSFIIL